MESFVVPGEVFVAIYTKREELVDGLIKKLEGGHQLSQEEQIGLAKLVKKSIAESRAERGCIREMGDRAKYALQHANGMAKKLEELLDQVRELSRGSVELG